ncbi:hypothetical protein AB9G23_04625 [Francisella philomiragia]|uniref:hypothetical protein n=1 Tax=Francisella philomiragia TaxID=28110 RepID=UPI001904DBA9|nr:hypothetical protein [Francisella philomiragia]MBK2026158.1 hypothetical protein [Francisella philomiragia]
MKNLNMIREYINNLPESTQQQMAKEGFDVNNDNHIEKFYQLVVKLNSMPKDQVQNLSLEDLDNVSGGMASWLKYTLGGLAAAATVAIAATGIGDLGPAEAMGGLAGDLLAGGAEAGGVEAGAGGAIAGDATEAGGSLLSKVDAATDSAY